MKAEHREAMARLEFGHLPNYWGVLEGVIVVAVADQYGEPEPSPHCDCPTYDSHDDIQRVIDGLRDNAEIAFSFLRELSKIVDVNKGDHGYLFSVELLMLLFATPEQKVEAILKATGGWD